MLGANQPTRCIGDASVNRFESDKAR
jgi:hypothetical protein